MPVQCPIQFIIEGRGMSLSGVKKIPDDGRPDDGLGGGWLSWIGGAPKQ